MSKQQKAGTPKNGTLIKDNNYHMTNEEVEYNYIIKSFFMRTCMWAVTQAVT